MSVDDYGREIPTQWHGMGHAGPPHEVADLVPRARQDWFDDKIAMEKLQGTMLKGPERGNKLRQK